MGPTALDPWCCRRRWYATCSLPVSRPRASLSFTRHVRLDDTGGYSTHSKWSWQMVLPDDRLLFGWPPPTSIWRGQNWGSNLFWSEFSASNRPGIGQARSWGSSCRPKNTNSNSPGGNKHLRSSLADLNPIHISLMAHSLSQTEQIGELRSRLPEKQPPLLPFLRTLLRTLPTDFTDDNTPDDSLYYFLCADPAADPTTLSSNANTLLRFLHPDKGPNPDDPAVKAAAHLVPLITHIKRLLTIPALRRVYDHCGLTGLQRLLNHKLRCIRCMPVEDTGRPLRQGPVDYPQLHLLLKYSP